VQLENERLGKKNDPGGEWARPDSDPVLDRYSNIHPWSNNRIHLKVPEGVNDYINASPVSLQSTAAKQSNLKHSIQDKYICMQGPKRETIDHTWHMLWHELATPYETSPAIIIMLSPTHGLDPGGSGKMIEKCSVYFPMDEDSPPIRINETDILGQEFKATVRFESKEPPTPGSSVEIRQFIMTRDEDEDQEKPIWHFLYPSWPDFGALEESNVAAIISVMEKSRKLNGKAENPRIVHCSAGVGRTGTFVALEFLMGELQGGAWEEDVDSGMDPVYDTVNQLRSQRRTMVQAYEQYAFLYEVLRKMWEEKYNEPCIGGDHEHGKKTRGARGKVNRSVRPQDGGCGADDIIEDGDVNVCAVPGDTTMRDGVNACATPGDHEHLNSDPNACADPARAPRTILDVTHET
jgi:protein-tyrosine phosphatase